MYRCAKYNFNYFFNFSEQYSEKLVNKEDKIKEFANFFNKNNNLKYIHSFTVANLTFNNKIDLFHNRKIFSWIYNFYKLLAELNNIDSDKILINLKDLDDLNFLILYAKLLVITTYNNTDKLSQPNFEILINLIDKYKKGHERKDEESQKVIHNFIINCFNYITIYSSLYIEMFDTYYNEIYELCGKYFNERAEQSSLTQNKIVKQDLYKIFEKKYIKILNIYN